MYRLLRAIVRLVFLVLCGLDVSGLENVPQQGGAIIAGTHTTMLDPVAIAIAIKRPLHFMGKAELFQIPCCVFCLLGSTPFLYAGGWLTGKRFGSLKKG